MLKACPSFEALWIEHLEFVGDSPEPMDYIAISDLVRHLTSKLAKGETEEFKAVFAVVDQWLTQGDHYVKEAAIVGLLEDLQNTNLHTSKTQPDDFLPWLSTTAERYWEKVRDFWEKGILITDD